MKRIRIGVIGTGIMGRRMIEAMLAHGGFEVAAVHDPDPRACSATRLLAPGALVFDDVSDLCRYEGLEAIYIASPPAFHLSHIEAALSAKLPVLCEKPLASSIADAHAIRRLVLDNAAPCVVNFPYASVPTAKRMRQTAASGKLGKIPRALIQLRFARWPRAWQGDASAWLSKPEQGGFTREVLSHFLFQAQRMFGQLRVEHAALSRLSGFTETGLMARLRHADGILHIDAKVEGPDEDKNSFVLHGTEGIAVLSDWYRLTLSGEGTTASCDPLPYTLDGFAKLVRHQDYGSLATVDEACNTAELVETLLGWGSVMPSGGSTISS